MSDDVSSQPLHGSQSESPASPWSVVLKSRSSVSASPISIDERESQRDELLASASKYFPIKTVDVDSLNRFNQGNVESCSLHGFARCLVNHLGFNFRIDMPSLAEVFPSDPLNTEDPQFGKYVAPDPREGIDWLGIGKIALFSYFYPIIETYYREYPGAQFGTFDPELEALVNRSLERYLPAEGAPRDFEDVVTEILQEYQVRKRENGIPDFQLWAVACDNTEYFRELLERNPTTRTVIGDVRTYFGLLIELKGRTPADIGYHVLIVDSILPDGRFRIRHSWAGEASVMTVEQLHRGECVVEKNGRTVACSFLGLFYIGPQPMVEPSVSPLLRPTQEYSLDSYHYKIGYENALRRGEVMDKQGNPISREEVEKTLADIYRGRGQTTAQLRADKASPVLAPPVLAQQPLPVPASPSHVHPDISVLDQEAAYASPSIPIDEAVQRYSTKRKYSSASSDDTGLDKKPRVWFIINPEETAELQRTFTQRLEGAEGGKKRTRKRTKRKVATKRKHTRKRTKTLRHKN